MTDSLTRQHRSWNMSRIRGRDTKPEMKLRSLLHQAGLRFRLHTTNLPGRPDIVLRKYNAVILVHGCFWHRHRGCDMAYKPKSNMKFWQAKFDENVKRDKKVRRQLTRLEWRVIVAWECDLKKAPERTADRIIKQIQRR